LSIHNQMPSLLLLLVLATILSQSIHQVYSFHHHHHHHKRNPAFVAKIRNHNRLTGATTSTTTATSMTTTDSNSQNDGGKYYTLLSSGSLPTRIEGDPHVENVLFVECGFGNDSHGQSSTKAAVRACRNAIEFNSIPSMKRLIPNGYDGLKLDVLLAVPPKYKDSLDLLKVQEVFPYGSIRFQVTDGGMIAPSGIAIEKLGDTNEDMVVVCVAVTIGY
jgi:uncharacterized protein (TIGR02058 family)